MTWSFSFLHQRHFPGPIDLNSTLITLRHLITAGPVVKQNSLPAPGSPAMLRPRFLRSPDSAPLQTDFPQGGRCGSGEGLFLCRCTACRSYVASRSHETWRHFTPAKMSSIVFFDTP